MKTSGKFFHYILYGVNGKGAIQNEVEMYGKICHLEGLMEATQAPIRKSGYRQQLLKIEREYNLPE